MTDKQLARTLLCHIGWYPTIEEARLGAKEIKQGGKKYRIQRKDVGCILYEVREVSNDQRK